MKMQDTLSKSARGHPTKRKNCKNPASSGVPSIDVFIPIAKEFKEIYQRYYQEDGELDKQAGPWRFALIMDALRFACQPHLWDAHRDGRFSQKKFKAFLEYIKADDYRELISFFYAVSDELKRRKLITEADVKEDDTYSTIIYSAFMHNISLFLGSCGLRSISTAAVSELVRAFNALSGRVQQIKLGATIWPDSVNEVFKFACGADNWIMYGDKRITSKNAKTIIQLLDTRDNEALLAPFCFMAYRICLRIDDKRYAYNAIMSTLLNL